MRGFVRLLKFITMVTPPAVLFFWNDMEESTIIEYTTLNPVFKLAGFIMTVMSFVLGLREDSLGAKALSIMIVVQNIWLILIVTSTNGFSSQNCTLAIMCYAAVGGLFALVYRCINPRYFYKNKELVERNRSRGIAGCPVCGMVSSAVDCGDGIECSTCGTKYKGIHRVFSFNSYLTPIALDFLYLLLVVEVFRF